jgi:excisionase family DNA binding protein
MMITAEEVAEMMGISRGAVYDLAAPKGPIPCVRYGRRCIRFKREDVQAHIEACRHTQVQMPSIRDPAFGRPLVKLQVSEPLNCFERLGLKVTPKLKPKG